MNLFKQALLERTNIEASKGYQFLEKKTQVLVPSMKGITITKNRLTHSNEAETSGMLIATDMAEKLNISVSEIDYRFSLGNVCLTHDIGQAPFGHDGQRVINSKIKSLGVFEGFDDNNNNFVVLEKNLLLLSDYTVASLIKYPHKLYPSQKKEYLPLLEAAIALDKEHFANLGIHLEEQTRTIACEIMDRADENSYICSDLADFFCLGNVVTLKELRTLARTQPFALECTELTHLANLLRSGAKTAIKAYFNDLKNRFNFNYTLTNKGVTIVDQDLDDYRLFLNAVSTKFFIEPKQDSDQNKKNLQNLERYIDYVIEHKYYPSKTYRTLIESSTSEIEKLTYIRDMVGETTDWYIINFKYPNDVKKLSA